MRKIVLCFLIVLLLSLLPIAHCSAQQVDGGEQSSGAFEILPIDDELLARMQQGGSFPADCSISREELRYLRVLHYDYEGNIQQGELVCNKSIADDLLEIFKLLYENEYQLCRMVLIDEYGASDEASMRDNNTSAFCFRKVSGAKNLSRHAQGLAVDINPLDNPCATYNAQGQLTRIEPDTPQARKNAARSPKGPHTITRDDLCYKLFIAHGFRWGGAWKSKKDYQHFEK